MLNETIKISTNLLSERFSVIGFLNSLVQEGVAKINDFLSTIFPSGEIYLVLIFCGIWTYAIKRKWELKWYFAVFYYLVFYSFMRFWGVGG